MTGEPASHVARSQLTTMALASALSVANLYYSQPLLTLMARSFHASVREVSAIPMLSQLGYAAGLLLFVPLGDMLERRRLIVVMLGAVAVALVGFAVSPTVLTVDIASFLVGLTTIAPQLILPMAANLAPSAERGKVVGIVMGGLLIGILGARTVSGLIGAWWGWRTVYWLAAALMAGLAIAVRQLLPVSRPERTMSYGALLRSLGPLVRTQPVLREASLLGGFAFGAFSAFWTTLVFLLERPPYHYGSAAAGLFGLIGIAGALAAPIVGRLADRKGPLLTVGIGLALALLSFGVFAAVPGRLWGLVLGVLLLDVGVQSNQVSNQTRIYALIPEARSRLNTVYMVSYFAGGSLGTLLGANAWALKQWQGVCLVGGLLVGGALVIFGLARVRRGFRDVAGGPKRQRAGGDRLFAQDAEGERG